MRSFVSLFFLVVPVLAACAGVPSVSPSGEAAAEQPRTLGVLFVERQGVTAPGQPAHIGARFVQYAGLPSAALPDLLGTPFTPGALAGCAERAHPSLGNEASASEARLLDVGTIEVRSGERALQLQPRRFPDLWNVVSGVIYATDEDLVGDDWHFSAAGRSDLRLGAFDVDVRAPAPLADVVIADQPLVAETPVSLPRQAFRVHWTHGDAADTVMLTVESAPGSQNPITIDCSARDEGLLEIDTPWTERLEEALRGGGTLTLHRLRMRPFSVPQVDTAHLVFDLYVRAHGTTP